MNFNYKWYIKDNYPAPNINNRNCKVFGTFICGGGSSMGYKLAGYNHLGGVEIDPKIASIYQQNHNPQHLFIEDIRKFNNRSNLPSELFNLDILDGSPPCSSFSMAGNREKDWGKKKQFKEGQAYQQLDDLVFKYINTIEKLRPKVAILENVKGIITGNAKAYSKKIKQKFENLGYNVQVFLLNAASMGVPQKRERVFFIGLRNDFNLPKLKLSFNEQPITFSQLDQKNIFRKLISSSYTLKLLKNISKTGGLNKEKNSLNGKIGSVGFYFCCLKNQVPRTLIANGHVIYHDKKHYISKTELCLIGSYPLDYNFGNINPQYIIGMSVPPVMTAQIANQIYLQWLSKLEAV